MTVPSVVIVSARRTPIGSLAGALAPVAAHELGATAIRAAVADAGIEAADIEEAVLGQVLTGGLGMNPARQATRLAGLPDGAPAAVVNQVCGSGLRAVALASQQIETGSARIVLAGGQESMTNAPHFVAVRQGKKLGDLALRDSAMTDGLTDAFYGYPMGNTAENVARQHQIGREAQDTFALASHRKASAAAREGRFAREIATVTVAGRKGEAIVAEDEHIRHEADMAAMAKLRPAFIESGTVTAGNASGVNDGAAALVLMASDEAERRGTAPLARIAGWAHAGIDPQVMGLGPIPASLKLLDRLGWQPADVDLWEINEAFAAQSLAVVNELGLDTERVNVNGGAIALGHPIGASGARVLVTLLHEMARRGARRGVATLCIGGGMGIALGVERD
ncbi:acetyl-CoA C-acetyltransferase [Devosia nitrariae]|uniref:Acetyl-CoA acetyltransferase n=1 Tax=Devosia nitrariae TaxID=2071872 RepID=A0ABQ5W8L7_9HYPH|nr:acetyl-CoA C-acetyltransferase [Devosia nitrariae]GLQ56223.1 acetyl-CoA acetyltransferase [Devosia nitrariae]